MSNPVANVEVVNTTYPPFLNATDYDLAFFTSTSNQSILFGASNSASNAILRLRSSNVEIFGNLGLTNTRVNMNGICLNRATTSGTVQNISTTVTSVPNLASNVGNVTLSLSSGQSNFSFVDSNNSTMVTMSNAGVFINTLCVASNIEMYGLGLPKFQRVDYARTQCVAASSQSPANYTLTYQNALYDNSRGYFTYTVNASAGDTTTINVAGLYSIVANVKQLNTGTNQLYWIDRNTVATNNLNSAPTGGVLAQISHVGTANTENMLSFTGYLAVNDVIRVKALTPSTVQTSGGSFPNVPTLFISCLYRV
jgi:hypothetical protein